MTTDLYEQKIGERKEFWDLFAQDYWIKLRPEQLFFASLSVLDHSLDDLKIARKHYQRSEHGQRNMPTVCEIKHILKNGRYES